jgi:hypothetical protein
MGSLYDYFSAPGDDVALTAFAAGPEAVGLPTVSTKGIDAYVQMGTLEALLTDVPYEEVVARERFSGLLSSPEDEGRWLMTLDDELRDALAGATPRRLGEIAVPWSRHEEFGGSADPAALASFLGSLAGVARAAYGQGHRLYCLMSL